MQETPVVNHLHGQTGQFKVLVNGRENSLNALTIEYGVGLAWVC